MIIKKQLSRVVSVLLAIVLLTGSLALLTSAAITEGAFNAKAVTADATFDWSSLGTNLFPDPTVNEFVDDGTGGKVYDKYFSVDIGDNGATNDSSGTVFTSSVK